MVSNVVTLNSEPRPPTLEERVRRLELSLLEVKWLVRVGFVVGAWKAIGVGDWLSSLGG